MYAPFSFLWAMLCMKVSETETAYPYTFDSKKHNHSIVNIKKAELHSASPSYDTMRLASLYGLNFDLFAPRQRPKGCFSISSNSPHIRSLF